MALLTRLGTIPGLRPIGRRSDARSWMMAAGLLLAFVGFEWLSFMHEYKGVPVTPWNPGLGILFAGIMMYVAVYGLVLFTGVVIAETVVLRTGLAWPLIVMIAVVIAISYTTAAFVARNYLRLDIRLNSLRDVLVLLGVAVAGAAVCSLLLSLLLLADRNIDAADLANSVLPMFVGDVIGIAVMTPLMLRLSNWRAVLQRGLSAAQVLELSLYGLIIATALWLIVGSGRPNDYKYFSVLFLPVAAVGARHGIDGACGTLAAIQLGLVTALHAYGYDAATFVEFQIVMFVLMATGLVVGVVVNQRWQADAAARQAEARLAESRAEAARAARFNLVGGMASALAHEINQPLTAARALARSVEHILSADDRDAERAAANVRMMVVQVDHAAGVVRRMREFLRRGQPHTSTLDIKDLLREALQLAQSDLAANAIDVDLNVAPGLPHMFGDRIQLQQVVLNLLRNAADSILDARSAKGRISIAATRANDTLEVSILDNGAGIPPDSKLFEPLSSSKPEGLGLGLSISSSIIEAHGGRLWLQSGEPGATEFRFSLPLQPPYLTAE
jgi:two-component system sensor kinase FixL